MRAFGVVLRSTLVCAVVACSQSDSGGTTTAPVIPPPAPTGLGGIFALLQWDNNGVVSIDPRVLASPYADGLTARVYWRDFYAIQTDSTSLNWGVLDSVFAKAKGAGKAVRLAIAPGFYSPDWVLHSVPLLTLPVPQGPLQPMGSAPLPVPWDPAYLGHWYGFIDQLAARYGSSPYLEWISATGPNSHNDEVNLPHGDSVSRATWLGVAAAAGKTTKAAQMDWLEGKLDTAWYRSIDHFETAFGSRGKHYTIALIDASFPVEGDSAREVAYKEELLAYGATHYPQHFGVQTNGLNGEPYCTNLSTSHPWWDYIRNYSGMLLTGFQTQAPVNLYCSSPLPPVVLRQAVDNAVAFRAHFIEIYDTNIIDTSLAGAIAYAHQQVLKTP
jgi:hypothetical protein